MISNLDNIIIFGASSFLGRNLRKAFLNIDVDVYAVFRSGSNIKEVELNSNEHHILFDGEIESLDSLKILKQDRTIVINCCGVTGLPDEVKNLSSILESNMGMTSKILQFMSECSFKKLVITESYWQFDEFGCDSANSLYAEAKIMQSQLAKYFSKKYGMNVVGLVLYDVYGESDHRSKLLNYLCKSISLNKSIELTSGSQFVDFIHISDVVEAYKLTAKYMVESGLTIDHGFNRFYVKTKEPLVSLKSKITETLSSLGYEAKLNWATKPSADHQVIKPYWSNEEDLLVPDWECKVLFKEGLKRLLTKYEK